jgi:outer membrane protein
MNTSFTLRTIISALITLSVAQQAHASDLWEIYGLALANDPSFQAAKLSHEAAEVNLPLAKSEFRPTLTSGAQATHLESDSLGASDSSDDSQININAALPLFDREKRINITQNEYLVEISALQLQEEKQRLILNVADRYFNLLAGQDAREVARLEKIAIKRQMDLATERLEVGLGTRTDLFDARARFKQAEANEIQAQNKINNDIALLKQIIGMPPEALAPLSESAPLELPAPNDVDAWIRKSIDQNIQLKIGALNLEVALQEIDKQKSGRIPTIRLFGTHRWQDSPGISGSSSGISVSSNSSTTTVGIAVNFPLYLGGSINLRTQQAGLQYNQADRLLEELRRQAETETTSAYLAVTSGVSQVEALYDAITAGESALEAKEEGFNAGLTTNLDVLDAQRDLSQSRTDYLRARYTYILAVLELERSAGQLDEEDIKRVTSWLKSSG